MNIRAGALAAVQGLGVALLVGGLLAQQRGRQRHRAGGAGQRDERGVQRCDRRDGGVGAGGAVHAIASKGGAGRDRTPPMAPSRPATTPPPADQHPATRGPPACHHRATRLPRPPAADGRSPCGLHRRQSGQRPEPQQQELRKKSAIPSCGPTPRSRFRSIAGRRPLIHEGAARDIGAARPESRLLHGQPAPAAVPAAVTRALGRTISPALDDQD